MHVDDSIDPARDLETITGELCLKDLAYVAQQRALREADVKKNPQMKLPPMFFTVMDKVGRKRTCVRVVCGVWWCVVCVIVLHASLQPRTVSSCRTN